jgi:hypothetical protein
MSIASSFASLIIPRKSYKQDTIYRMALPKSLRITILLAVLVSGVGHIYLGFLKRGIIILIVGIALWWILRLFTPFPLNWFFFAIYWAWQIIDAHRHYKKLKTGLAGQTRI